MATRNTAGGLAARMGLTALGAAALIIGAFLKWAGATTGVKIHLRSLIQRPNFTSGVPAKFLHSAGFLMIVLGLAALVGLGFRSGWLTRIAGTLGIVGIVLFLIQLYRVNGHPSPGPGLWICLVGAVAALIGGFLGTRRVAVTPAAPVTPATGASPSDRV